MSVAIAAAAIVLIVTIVVLAYVRRPRQDAGVTSFQRHIDALSPESRRAVMDRVRPSYQPNADVDSQEPTD